MITDAHHITICNDKKVHMVQLPLAAPNESSAIGSFARLSTQNNQTKSNQPTNAQPMTHNHNNNETSTLLLSCKAVQASVTCMVL